MTARYPSGGLLRQGPGRPHRRPEGRLERPGTVDHLGQPHAVPYRGDRRAGAGRAGPGTGRGPSSQPFDLTGVAAVRGGAADRVGGLDADRQINVGAVGTERVVAGQVSQLCQRLEGGAPTHYVNQDLATIWPDK